MSHDEAQRALFIDEHLNIVLGAEAASRVLTKNAEARFDSRLGVTCVDRSRWQEAQRYERRTWLEKVRHGFDDRNGHHRERFAGYGPIRGRHFKRAIELGCGPFTNMRYILPECEVDEVYLLDPLLPEYLTHCFCKYHRGRIGGLFNERWGRLRGYSRHPARAFSSKINDWRIGGIKGRRVALEPSMIEQFTTELRFDLVIMINVLEHCQDAGAVFSAIDKLLTEDGFFVYHDKMYHALEVERSLSLIYDAGHPLRVDHSFVDAFLDGHFNALLRSEFLSQGLYGTIHSDIYFIGQHRIGPS